MLSNTSNNLFTHKYEIPTLFRKKKSALQMFSIGFCELGSLNPIAAGISFPVNISPILLPSLDNVQLMMS